MSEGAYLGLGRNQIASRLAEPFIHQVRDALSRLYDAAYLERHPLAIQLDRRGHDGGANVDELRAQLIAAVEALKPPDAVPGSSKNWRPYRIMQLRYLEARDPADVQRQLGLSKSPYYIEHERALEAVAAALQRQSTSGRLPENSAAGLDQPWPNASWFRRRERRLTARWLVVLGAFGFMMAVLVWFPRPSLAPAARANPSGASPSRGRLLFKDDFRDSEGGLFRGPSDGLTVVPDSVSGGTRTLRWDRTYDQDALVLHLGPPTPPFGLTTQFLGHVQPSNTRLDGDFAFEVSARATKSVAQAMYGLIFQPGLRSFGLSLRPSGGNYFLYETGTGAEHDVIPIVAPNPAINRNDRENRLRLEVRGDEIGILVNGSYADHVKNEAFAARPASVGVIGQTYGAPTEGVVEVRFTDFRVYSLQG